MANKENTAALIASAAVGVIAILVASIAWSALWFGLTLSVLWGWFVVPMFGAAEIGIAQAYGLILVIKALHARTPSKHDGENDVGGQLVRIVFLPPFIAGLLLLIGWVVSIWA